MAKEYLNVRGSQSERPNELEINVDTAYVRKNIITIDESNSENGMGFKGWQYDEIQYSLNEFQELTSTQVKLLEDENASLFMSSAIMIQRIEQLETDNAELILTLASEKNTI